MMMAIQRLVKKVAAVAVSGVLLAACAIADPLADKAKQGKALFDEHCKTMAGPKIYRRVDDVEGIALLKIRPRSTERDMSDRNWPGAAFSLESQEEGYITTFLAYEHSNSSKGEPVSAKNRGFISTDYQPANASNLPGYRYVDVVDEKTGERWRYSGYYDRPWERDPERYSSKNPYSFWKLKREVAPADGPRYGVTYEDHVIPEERALGLASSTVKVIDLKTQEVLGEFRRYAWTPGVLEGVSRSSANPNPWLSAYKCGGDGIGSNAQTRKFVDQVLTPRKDQ